MNGFAGQISRRRFIGGSFMTGFLAGAVDLATRSSSAARAAASPRALRVGLTISPVMADPHRQQASADYFIYANVLDRLIDLDPHSMEPRPALATSWQATNPTTYVFKLRGGVKFHDGSPFDAAAAKKNLERMMDAPSTKSFTGRYSAVEAPQSDTLILRLKEPYAYTVSNLGFFQMSLISPATFDKGDEWLSTHAAGTGPFTLKEWVPKDHFVLERNTEYWGGAAKVEQIVFQVLPDPNSRLAALKAGDLDVASDLPVPSVAPLRTDPTLTVLTLPVARTYFLMYQLQDPVLSNVKVRQAIATAINRRALVDQVTQHLNRLATNIMPPEAVDGAATNPGVDIEYNPEKARALLQQSGVNLSGKTLEMIPDLAWVGAAETAQAIQEDLRKIGLTVKITTYENAQMNALLKDHKYQLSPQGWLCADPDSALRRIFSRRSPWAYPYLLDPKFEVEVDRASVILDNARRDAAYKNIFREMLSNAIYTPLYNKWAIVGTGRRIQGLLWSPFDVPILRMVTLAS